MKLLVTGAAGFIGSHFVEAAERAGHACTGVDLLTYAGRSKNLPPIPFGRSHSLRFDICDAATMCSMFEHGEPDAIVHLAAETHVARSIDSRDEFLRTNVSGTNVLLEEALRYWEDRDRPPSFRFLHVSTDEVYGSLGPDDPPWTERSPYAPNNPYAASKAAGDHLVRSYNRTFGLPTIITHSSNNYGTRQHPEKLVPTLIRQCLASQPMTIHGDGLNVRDWLHVKDHCSGLLAALERGTPGETYNLGGECEKTNCAVAQVLAYEFCWNFASLCDTPLHIRLVADRPGNDRRYATNITKARTALNWSPRRSMAGSIHDIVQWHIDNPTYADDYGR